MRRGLIDDFTIEHQRDAGRHEGMPFRIGSVIAMRLNLKRYVVSAPEDPDMPVEHVRWALEER